jgi:hypothetical protein
MAKFHEERGKIKCACWQCQGRKEMQEQIKKEKEQESKNKELASCAGCDKEFRINRINEEGLCKKCEGNFAS